jgi:hypothetical protein
MAEGTWEGCADPYADAATDDAANYAATRLMFRDYQAAMQIIKRMCYTILKIPSPSYSSYPPLSQPWCMEQLHPGHAARQRLQCQGIR